jgi:DNA-binding XRE family transcriptional regulator
VAGESIFSQGNPLRKRSIWAFMVSLSIVLCVVSEIEFASVTIVCPQLAEAVRGHAEHEIIRQARIRLGLSQQQVATLVSIQIRQYQRLEYGESDVQKLGMRAGLSLCIVLEIDPYDLIFGTHSEIVEDLRARRPAKGNLKVRHKS